MGFVLPDGRKRASSPRFAASRSRNLGPLRNYQTVSEGTFSETGFPASRVLRNAEARRYKKRAGGPEVDREITERFGEVLEQARRAELDHWAETARGRLALIVVLDQFSRNVYRGSPLSYTQDEKALRLAVEGIDLGMERELGSMERFFFWLPLGHSEDLSLHERSVSHAEEEAANAPSHLKAGAEFGASQAKAARDVIARFGRHPHRNEILGRDSTPEELEYLRTETPPHLRRPPS